MPRLTKIYTRKGDDGTTALAGNRRVAKDSLRVTAYGTVDELNASIGVTLASGLSERLAITLRTVQNELFHLGAELSFPAEDDETYEGPRVDAHRVQNLEQLIDEMVEIVGPLQNFILPGGSPGAAHLHVARTICRRAERNLVSLAREEKVSEHALSYLNRLSDALFVMARYENHVQGIPEPLWDSRA